jgi:DNA-binding PadR family transcriptional regulator
MTPTLFHILLTMVDGERHGYAIMREVAERTGERLRLGPGSLYWAISRLQEVGMIVETDERPDRRLQEVGMIVETDERPDPEIDDERRRYYRITDLGRRVLKHEAETLAEIVEYARAKNIIHGQETV